MDPEEVQSNATTPSPKEEFLRRYHIYMRIYLEFYTIICLLSVITNVLLLVAIVKFKKLRNVTNIILAQLCALYVVYSLFTPVNLRVFHYLTMDDVALKVYYVFGNIQAGVMFCMCLFMVLLLTDWYIKVYKQHNYGKFVRVYLFVIGLIYFCLLCLVVVSMNTARQILFAMSYLGIAGAFFLAAYLIVLNIIHAVKKRKVQTKTFNLGLIVCNIIVLAWCPSVVVTLFTIYRIYHILVNILFVLIGFTSPVVMAIYLYINEANFNVFLRRIITCKCTEYKNEELQEDRVVYNNAEVA